MKFRTKTLNNEYKDLDLPCEKWTDENVQQKKTMEQIS